MKEHSLMNMESDVLAEGREWTRALLEKRLQQQADTMNVCPESGLVLKKLRTRTFTLMTVAGVVTVNAPYGHSSHTDSWCCPARIHWGLEDRQRLSPEFERRLAYTATQTGSFEKASLLAGEWGSPVSDDAIHALVQRAGARALDLPPQPSHDKSKQSRENASNTPAFSLVIMIDGWKVRERGARWGEKPQAALTERINWHEVKSAVIYQFQQRAQNQSGRGMLIEKKVVACASGTSVLDFGAAVQERAMCEGLACAKEVFVVADGAVWIWNLIEDRFSKATKTLDFYHASEHLWGLAHYLHPSDNEAAKRWVEPLLHSLRHDQQHRIIERLEELLSSHEDPQIQNAPAQCAELDSKIQYFRNHKEHLNYASLAARDAPIGSGSMESQCSQFQNRLKRRGQFWSPDGLCHMLALDVVVKNHEHPYLWN
ncbi:MAG: UPF0236 family protein [Verrucomicrobiota bacterium]|nr:UPF0236 family protein [Verrucomicrobiota bacterium]